MLCSKLSQAPLQRIVQQRFILRGAEFRENDWCLANRFGTVLRDVAGGGGRHAEGIEAGLVELGFNDGAVTGIEVLGHAVEVEFVDDIVAPWVGGEVEDYGVAAVAVADGIALVEWGGVEI